MHNVVNCPKTPQDFKSMFGHFTTLCMKGLMWQFVILGLNGRIYWQLQISKNLSNQSKYAEIRNWKSFIHTCFYAVCAEYYPANIYLFKAKDRNTRKRCEICSKLTIKGTRTTSMNSYCYLWTYFTSFFQRFFFATLNR